MYDDPSNILECILSTHAPEGKEIIRAQNIVDEITVVEFEEDFSHVMEIQQIASSKGLYLGSSMEYVEAAKSYYPEIRIPAKKSDFVSDWIKSKFRDNADGPLIVLHPSGSKFSEKYLTQKRKTTGKRFSTKLWSSIIKFLKKKIQQPNIILLGLEHEKSFLSEIREESGTKHLIFFATDFSLLSAIDLLKCSHVIIGADSFAKSVGFSQKIPTIALVNDVPDPIRDKYFLNPYQNDPNVCIIRNTNIKSVHDIISEIEQFLRKEEIINE